MPKERITTTQFKLNQALVAENRQVNAENQQLRAEIATWRQLVQEWEREYERLRGIANTHNDEYWALMTERDNLEARVLNLREELQEIRDEE